MTLSFHNNAVTVKRERERSLSLFFPFKLSIRIYRFRVDKIILINK